MIAEARRPCASGCGQRITQGPRPPIGRPRALAPDQIALAERMRASSEPVPVIAETLGVSRATLYRTWPSPPRPDRPRR